MPAIRTETANYTATAADETILMNATSGDVTVTLPAAAAGKRYTIKKLNAPPNKVKIVPSSGTIEGVTDIEWSVKYQGYTVQSDGTNWWIVAKF
jgi:hypothetical protein